MNSNGEIRCARRGATTQRPGSFARKGLRARLPGNAMKREGSRGFFRSFRLGGRVAGREIPIVSFGRSASRWSVAVLVAVVLTAAHALTAGTSPRPNVVFILADDLGI